MILQMRDQRYGCIQSEAQLRFSYVAILVATHNFMAELPIATVPELVERARQEANGMLVLLSIVALLYQSFSTYFKLFTNS